MKDETTPLDIKLVRAALEARVVEDEIGEHYLCTYSAAKHAADPVHNLIATTEHCVLCQEPWPCVEAIDYAAWQWVNRVVAQLEGPEPYDPAMPMSIAQTYLLQRADATPDEEARARLTRFYIQTGLSSMGDAFNRQISGVEDVDGKALDDMPGWDNFPKRVGEANAAMLGWRKRKSD